MPDFNPALLRRMLLLRQYALFASADLEELANMAENVTSSRFAAGAVVAPAGERPSALQFVVEGDIATPTEHWGARQVFGALEVAAARELAAPAIATVATETLELSATDFDEVIEDNFGVMLSTLRMLCHRMLDVPPAAPPRPIAITGPLGLVERLLILRRLLPFASTRVQALAMLAHASEELRWPAGTVLQRAGDPARGGLVVVEGTLRVERDGRTRMLGPGAALGHIETLARTSFRDTVEATTELRALRSSGADLLDMLEDHPEVGTAMIAAFARALLDAPTVN